MKPFQQFLARHYAPTFLGVKPANLASMKEADYAIWKSEILWFMEEVRDLGFDFEVFCGYRGRYLLMVYQRQKLNGYLKEKQTLAMLEELRYPIQSGDLKEWLRCLKERLELNGDFPHEVGLFLGYPPEDVRGFCECQGKGYKRKGVWKVYSDEGRAEELFQSYEWARICFTQKLEEGYTPRQIMQKWTRW